MTKSAAPVRSGRYASLDRLPGVAGSQVQRQLAAMKVRLIARYGLFTVPGRPEELIQPAQTRQAPGGLSGRTISIGYGCGTIRIRKHGGRGQRTWEDWIDIQPNDGWHAQVYDFLDGWLSSTRSSGSVVHDTLGGYQDNIESIRLNNI